MYFFSFLEGLFSSDKESVYKLHDYRIGVGPDLNSGLSSGMFHSWENKLVHGGAYGLGHGVGHDVDHELSHTHDRGYVMSHSRSHGHENS